MASGMGWTKKCRDCGRERHTSSFSRQATQPGQLPICMTCASIQSRSDEEAKSPNLSTTTRGFSATGQ